MDDNDFDLEPINRGRWKPFALTGVLALAAVGVWFANARLSADRSAESLREASTHWNRLSRCLVGERLPEGERVSTFVRRIEVGLPPVDPAASAAERQALWPYRCAQHASRMTHALFEMGSAGERYRMLAAFASRAATALETGELHTGRDDPRAYLDEIFELARRAQLPPGERATGPLPPPAAHPLAARALSALFAGEDAASVVGSDPVPSRALRILVGGAARRVCTLGARPEPERSLTFARCETLPFARAPASAELVAAEDDAPTLVRVRAAGTESWDLHPAARGASRLFAGAFGAFAEASGRLTVLSRAAASVHSNAAGYELVRLDGEAASRPRALALPAPATLITPTLVWNHVVVSASVGDLSSSANSVVSARLFAAALDESAPRFAEIGALPAGAAPPLLACRTEQSLVLGARGQDDRVALSFLRASGWSRPVETTAPVGASFTCRGTEATFTWTEISPHRFIHQVRCTPAGCSASRGTLPEFDGEMLVSDLDGRVLFLGVPRGGLGLRMRLAPVADVYSTNDVVVIDDAAHGGLAIEAPRQIFVRASSAVVLVTSTGTAHETYGVQFDAAGGFRGVRPIESNTR